MFTAEGIFPVVITEVVPIAEPKFAQGEYDFDVAIKVRHRDVEGQEDWWRGEMSDNYGKGAASHLTQRELTEQVLRRLGWESDNIMDIMAFLGNETTAKVKQKNEYFNVITLAPNVQAATPVDADKAAKILAMMRGNGGDSAPEPDKGAEPKKAASPFAKKAVTPF